MRIHGDGVVVTALYRDSELAQRTSARHINNVCGEPVVLARLVELNGMSVHAALRPAGTVDRAWRTNTIGEIEEELEVVDGEVLVPMRAYGVTTVALDVTEWRPEARNLDSHRDVWARAHRAGDQKEC
jgi:hypothetical protein